MSDQSPRVFSDCIFSGVIMKKLLIRSLAVGGTLAFVLFATLGTCHNIVRVRRQAGG